MRVLVIGGTGFMGLFAVRELVESGHQVTVFHRGKTNHGLPSGVEEIHADIIRMGDRYRLPEMETQFRAVAPDIVLDMLLGTEADAQITVELFRGFVGRIVAASSCDVYRAYGRLIGKEPGDPVPSPATENAPLRETPYPYRGDTPKSNDDPARWTDDYDKILVEKVILSQPDIAGTVIRLPMVYGEYDRQHRLYPYLKRIQDQRPAIIMDEGTAQWRTCRGYVADMGHALALAVVSERAAGQVYNVAEQPALTELEWLQQIGRATAWTGRVVTVPLDKLPQSLHSPLDWRQHLDVDSTSIRQTLGYTEQIPFEERLQRTIAWENANPPQQVDPAQFNYDEEDRALAGL